MPEELKEYVVRYRRGNEWRYYDGHGDTGDVSRATRLSVQGVQNVIYNMAIIENRDGEALKVSS